MAANKQAFTLQDLVITIDGNIVGGAQSVNVTYAQENKPLHEGGTKKPREILDGSITVNGTVERLFLDKETVNDLIDLTDGNNPYFNLVGVTKNKNPERKITIIDCKFKGFTIDLALSDETKISQEFDALDINIE